MPPSTPSRAPAEFELIQRVLRELQKGGKSASLDKWTVAAQQKLAEYRTAGGLKVKKECDAVELGFRRAAELIDLLRTARVKQG